jgi:hypothetical protein
MNEKKYPADVQDEFLAIWRSFHDSVVPPDLGTPQDITLQELRVECFFPMDDATAATARTPFDAAVAL